MESKAQPYPIKYYKEVNAKAIEWLWYPYIAYGKITIIQGDPGEGKSTLSNGKPVPLEIEKTKPQAVVYQNSEDGKEDTIVPRLLACGANLEKVSYIDEEEATVELGDERLEKVIEQTGARVLILDPIQAYWGANTDMNRAGAIRPIMNHLAHIAERRNCAIIMVGHMNKANGKGLYRGLGSIDIAAAARSVLLVAKLSNQPNMRVLSHVKSNLAPLGDSILFTVDDKSVVSWVRRSKMTAEQVLDESYNDEYNKTDHAILIIRKNMESGECSANKILQECELNGISKRTVNAAKVRLNIVSVKRKDGWYWVLDEDNESDDAE